MLLLFGKNVFWAQSHCSNGSLQKHLSSGVVWVKRNQKMGSVACCWQLLLPLSSSEFCKLLNDLKMLSCFKMSESSNDWVSFFFFSAAFAHNFSRVKLRRNKFWSHSPHLSSVEGKFVYWCYFSDAKIQLSVSQCSVFIQYHY